ncbi:MAG: hypothetical protein D3M94_08125 [Rhodocyclales bacterium GT-UBC]|nr:MAG: hypothetical protein D3M94_08125 [Rhodocyclales bacterium GT-UBC]
MTIHATVALFKNAFIATLSDGRSFENTELRDMARALHNAGVSAAEVEYEWRTGQRMITAGQQVAMRAEIRRLERTRPNLAVAA